MLALIAERVTGGSFADLVQERVCTPAGMGATAFLRSDELPGRAAVPSESMRYGLGFGLHGTRDAVMLEGFDPGVSFRTVHDAGAGVTHTAIANTSDGAWPITRHLDGLLTAAL